MEQRVQSLVSVLSQVRYILSNQPSSSSSSSSSS
ncbi:hypothetical protein NGA_0399300, partial [Nannochloropsis gaditana CCMP526]